LLVNRHRERPAGWAGKVTKANDRSHQNTFSGWNRPN
jgi:hypothetical protein